jgi:hypothetical protein
MEEVLIESSVLKLMEPSWAIRCVNQLNITGFQGPSLYPSSASDVTLDPNHPTCIPAHSLRLSTSQWRARGQGHKLVWLA